MNKQETLDSMLAAKEAHKLQMKKLDDVIQGKSIDDPTAVSKVECEFGAWLYNPENHIREIIGSLFYGNIDKLHERWHYEYVRIHKIFFAQEVKKGFFSKFGKTKALSDMEIDKAKLYYSELKITTSELLKALESAQRRVSALSETKFK